MAVWASLSKKEKKNGLVGAKNRGGAGHLRKREKTNGLVCAKTVGGAGKSKEKRENE